MVVDFHVHSTASDGTLKPHRLAAIAAGRNFAAMALTDHDNADGVDEFLSARPDCKTTLLIPGVELSIDPGEGFDKFHLLALGVDAGNAAFKALLEKVRKGRDERNARIFENFRRIGIPDISPAPHGEVLARPHFAKWLADNGYAKTPGEAFAKYLHPCSPRETRCYEERYHPPQEETFRAVHEAGGICVMAHPKFWRFEWRKQGSDFDAAARELARLKEAGLDGLEAIYQANTQAEDVGFSRIALELGLLATAGSDFHGANKPSVALGMEVEESFVAPVMERLSLRCNKQPRRDGEIARQA